MNAYGKSVLVEAGEVALALLKFTDASSIPPLKAATAGVLHIVELIKGFRSHRKKWKAFGDYIQNSVAWVIRTLPDAPHTREDLNQNLERLRITLEGINSVIQDRQKSSTRKFFWNYIKDPDSINGMKNDLDMALQRFQLEFMTTIGLDVAKVLDKLSNLNIADHLERVREKLGDHIASRIALDARVEKLAVARDASWNPARTCRHGTRTAMLEQIWQWIISRNSTGAAQIFFLTSVAGAGKSAIAHSVAQRCYQEGILAASFFFDRNVTDRPSMFFTTIARQLAGHDVGFHRQISHALRLDQDLPMAPGPRQFKELILTPCQTRRVSRTLAIVIDGLDEGYNDELLDVFLDEVPKLPANFRIFLTSRDGQEFNQILSRQRHVHCESIRIAEQANLNDIALVIPVLLADIARWKGLNRGWPGPELTKAFTQKAGGLFLWVSTVCKYLRQSIDPNHELRLLITSHRTPNLSAQEKMDELYTTILRACNWRDKAFSEGYQLLMGAIMATRIPLSARAIAALHGTSLKLNVETILQPVASLLTGIDRPDEPIRPLHLSFRDFITSRASSDSQFYISYKKHSARLALLCLAMLNAKISPSAPGLGFLYRPDNWFPTLDANMVSEEVWYACRFWTHHILNVKGPSAVLINALTYFLSNHLVAWVKILVSMGRFQSLVQVRKWMKDVMPGNINIQQLVHSAEHAQTFYSLSVQLSKVGRRDESLQSLKEAVLLYQWLAKSHPAVFIPIARCG